MKLFAKISNKGETYGGKDILRRLPKGSGA